MNWMQVLCWGVVGGGTSLIIYANLIWIAKLFNPVDLFMTSIFGMYWKE